MKMVRRKSDAIEIARRRFLMPKSRGSTKSRLDFDGFLEAFCDDSNTFAAIGERAGISRQAVHQIYHKFFAQLFRRGRIKRSRMQSRTRKERAQKLRTPSDDPFMRRVFLEAHRLKVLALRVECRLGGGKHRFRKDMVEVNGAVCLLHRIGNVFYPSDHHLYGYSALHLTRKSLTMSEFVIVWRKHAEYGEDFFICRSGLLLAQFSEGVERKELYIPWVFPKRRRQRPVFDWLPYKNAWHLLAQESIVSNASTRTG